MWHCVLTRFCNRTGGVSTRLCQVTRHRAGLCFTLASFILKLKCYSSKQVPCTETQNFYKCHSSVEYYRLSIVYWCGCENLSIRSIAIAITSYTIIDIWHAYVLTSHGWVITYHTYINVIIYVCPYSSSSATIRKTSHMGILPDTRNCGLRMRRECRERFPRHRLLRKPLLSDPGMHHGTCMTQVSWCMSGSLTRGGRKKTFPALPAHAQPAILRIW